MNVFSDLRKALAAAILLVLLCPGALAVGGDFNAELDIQRTKDPDPGDRGGQRCAGSGTAYIDHFLRVPICTGHL